MVEQRGEPLPLSLLRCLTYASQRLCHASPDLRPVRALLVHVSLGPRPSLHRLRRRCQSGFVRRLHRYLGEVRLLGLVHHRLRFLTFPTRTGSTLPAKPKISRFPYKERPHMPGSTTTPDPPSARIARSFVLLSMMMTMSAPGTTFSFAAQYLAYAYPCQRFAETLTGDRA